MNKNTFYKELAPKYYKPDMCNSLSCGRALPSGKMMKFFYEKYKILPSFWGKAEQENKEQKKAKK